MKRSFEPSDLIRLPRLNAEGTLALSQALITEAREAGELSAALGEALEALEGACRALAGALLRRLRAAAGGGVDPETARAADAAVDNAWGALRDFLSAWARLGDEAEAERAGMLLARVFPDGLSFLNKRYKAEWADSETRLLLIDQEGLDADIEALGGATFLRVLRRAHGAYGEALHVTTRRGPDPEAIGLRRAFEDAHAAMRAYLVQVAASRRPRDPATVALADRLNGPIIRWRADARSYRLSLTGPRIGGARRAAPH
jgi:hypothetical protein